MISLRLLRFLQPIGSLSVAVAFCVVASSDLAATEIILKGGSVIDGSGSPAIRADVAIDGDRIVYVAPSIEADIDSRVIDVAGLVVTPGFIDMHAHIDPITRLPEAQSMVSQGVTTAVGGPDGSAPWPTGSYLDRIERQGVGLNVCLLVGHNSIRRAVMALDDRAPSDAELERMRHMIDRSMQEGAWGISTGLKYLPGAYAKIDEVVELSRVAAKYNGYYTSHLREEGLGLIDSVREAIEIGRQAKIPIVLTHHKVVGQPMWGKSRETLAMVEAARAEGIDVKMDQYPYTATYTGISILVPAWARAGGNQRFLARLQEAETRARIKQDIVFNIINDRGGGDLRRVQFGLVEWNKGLEGKTLHDWAGMKGLEPTPENGAELVIEALRNGGASCIYHVLDEQDVERIMRHPLTMIGSDGRLTEPGSGHPHPRWYGAFPRVLGHYARDRGVLKLEEAVRKMTSLSAKRIGLKDRGLVKEGFFADLVVFDPKTIIDKSTFQKPHQYPEGIHHVFVNGEAAITGGKFRGLRAGRVLRRGVDNEPDRRTWPGKNWAHIDPQEDAGWSAEKLDAAFEFAKTLKTSALMLIHEGRVVKESGETKRPFMCHSMRKSILSALFGPHVRNGTVDLKTDLKSLGIDDKEPSLTDIEKTATIGDLLKARSGVYHPALYETKAMAARRPKRGSHEPGAFWYYNNWDFNAVCTIFENLTGRGIFEEFEDRLVGPLGMQDFVRAKHTRYVTGADSVHPAYPFQLSARDLARLGLLFARGGEWKGKRIIPRSWVVESTQSYSETGSKGGYGYMWWTATKEYHLPGAELPEGAYSARGYRGHKVLIVPQWDLVIVHRVDTFEKEGSVSSVDFGQLVKLILDARIKR